tara:strand:+ start:1160 stop:1414 length:255 start_codon:yes stop_codon:yes gene_type:complete
MKESTALIKLTLSEIQHIISCLKYTEDCAEFFDVEERHTSFTMKIRKDFNKIKEDIIEGEENLENDNKMEEKSRSNPQNCEVCD